MFYLMTYSTHFNYSYMMLDMIMDKLKIVTEKTHCHYFIGYSSGFTAKVFYIHHPTDRTIPTTAFIAPPVEYWLE